jgi:hypothetical protein
LGESKEPLRLMNEWNLIDPVSGRCVQRPCGVCMCDLTHIKWYQILNYCLYISGRKRQEEIREHSDIHQVVSKLEFLSVYLRNEEAGGDKRAL